MMVFGFTPDAVHHICPWHLLEEFGLLYLTDAESSNVFPEIQLLINAVEHHVKTTENHISQCCLFFSLAL